MLFALYLHVCVMSPERTCFWWPSRAYVGSDLCELAGAMNVADRESPAVDYRCDLIGEVA